MNVYHIETTETNFDELMDFAKTRRARKLAHNTWLIVDVEKPEEGIAIQYHRTEIVTFYSDGSIRLNTNGHTTSTTKERMNAFLPKGITIFQSCFAWYVVTEEGTFEFEDGMVVSYDGFTDAKVADVEGDRRAHNREKRAELKARKEREAIRRVEILRDSPAIGPRNFDTSDRRFPSSVRPPTPAHFNA